MSGRPPYPGLRSFDRDEAEVFFGRDRCLDGMAQTLQDTRFLAVLGPSGSGKSSLVRSGLFMHLEAGLAPKAGSRWTFLDIRHPRTHPFRELARATLECEREQANPDPDRSGAAAAEPDKAGLEERRRELRTGPLSLVRWWRDHPRHPNENLLVLVDQFEELFGYTTPRERDSVEAFVDLLLRTAANDELDIYVVLTMRSEFLGGCALFPGLAEQINRSLSLTPRMTRDECRSAITGPAYGEELTLEPLLVTTLLNDMNSLAQFDEPAASEDGAGDEAQGVAELRQSDLIARRADQLPLMQHLLNWMWNQASARGKPDAPIHLTLDDYLALGGLRGAMSRHAKEVMDSTGEPELTSRIFRSLTDQPAVATSGSAESSAVRRRRTVAELAAETGASEDQVRAVVDAFRAEGVSMLTPEPGVALDSRIDVDITHESLIRQWSDLSGWIREEAESGRAWQELLRDVGEDKPIRGLDLSERRNWWQRAAPHAGWAARYGGGFAAVDAALTSNWRVERRQKLRLRAMTAGLGGVAAISVVVFGTAVVAVGRAQKAQDRAIKAAETAVHRTERADQKARQAFNDARDAAASQAAAQWKAAEAAHDADAARAAAAEAARRMQLADAQSAAAQARGKFILEKSQILSARLVTRAYHQLQVFYEKSPQDAVASFKDVDEDMMVVRDVDPAAFATLEPELEKVHGDLLTYQLDTKQMLTAAEQSLVTAKQSMAETSRSEAGSEPKLRGALRAVQAETQIGRAAQLEGRSQDALAAFDRATSLMPAGRSEELSLARAEALYERASTLLENGQLRPAAEAAAQCRETASLAEQLAPDAADDDPYGKAAQMKSRPDFVIWRCQTIVAAAAGTDAEASTGWQAAAAFYDEHNPNESEDVALARADMLFRYFRRPGTAAGQKLPPGIETVVNASLKDILGDEDSDSGSSATSGRSAGDLYPLIALHRINFHNEYVRWWLQQRSGAGLPRILAIMNATNTMLYSASTERPSSGLIDAVSRAADSYIANWIALERVVDTQVYEESVLPGAETAIRRQWQYLEETKGQGPNVETAARASRLRAQAVDLIEEGRSQQASERFGRLARTGHGFLNQLCSEKADLPSDANCQRLGASMASVESSGAALAASLAASEPRHASKAATAVPVWTENGLALGGFDPVVCFNLKTTPDQDNAIRKGAESQRRCILRKGRLQYGQRWDGQIWLFESDANRKLFVDSRGAQAPRFGGYAIEAVATGNKAPSRPIMGSVRGYVANGELYLTRRFAGNLSPATIEKAEAAWPKLKDAPLPAAPAKAENPRP